MADTTALKNRIRAAIKANDNQEITGPVLQQALLDIVDELDLYSELENEVNTRQQADTTLNNLITGIKNNIDNGYVYAGIATPSTTPVSGKVFYAALQAGTYTNFGGTAVTEGITILKHNGTSWTKEQVLFTDGGVFDISAYHATGGTLATYDNLEDALGTNGNNIPQSLKKGGMSVKFVQSSDNKYVQYRLRHTNWTTNVNYWENPRYILNLRTNLFDEKTTNLGWLYVMSGGQSTKINGADFGQTAPIKVAPGEIISIYNSTPNTDKFWMVRLASDDIDDVVDCRQVSPSISIDGGSYYEYVVPPRTEYISVGYINSRDLWVYVNLREEVQDLQNNYDVLRNETVIGAVYDVSAKNPTAGPNNDGKWESLSALLSDANLNTLIPTAYRKGGMSIKFVRTSDNKYVQYRLMSDSFGTIESDWQNIGLVQQIGLSETVAMSQKAVTDELNKTAIIVDDDSQANLNIGDQQGNVIVQFEGGHIKTKEFDSSKVIKSISDDSAAELNIGDEEGNVIAQFKGGHIKTKEFDSSKAGYSPYIKFQGKRFAVIGDSISSYRGITKSGYATYYPKGDVISSAQTWWGILRDTLGMSCVNRAWSGSQCTGDSAASATAWAACSTQRILDIGDDGAPDIVLCYIGTNDWQDSQRDQGNWTYNDAVPADGVITEFKPAYAMMLYKIQTYYPNARIFCCTIIEDKARDKTAGWPANNSRGISLCAFNESIKYVADAFGANIIDLHNCGLTYANIASFAVDGGLHPNAAGHALMANKIIQDLISKY